MAISRISKTVIFGFCSFLFLSTAQASTETFKIKAEYKRPDFSDRGIDVKLSQIVDQTTYLIEVKTVLLKVVASVLSVEDGKTTYHEDMKTDFSIGEYCTGTQTPVGEYEAFKLDDTPQIEAAIIREAVQTPNMPKPPGTPGAAPGYPQGRPSYKITTVFSGIEHLRGWNFTFENPLCNLKNIPEEDSEQLISTTLEFDSKKVKGHGHALVVDQRENGFGWVFTITRY